ncbi:unnamed protein product, partial [Larinioides sclopetarius]
MLGILSVTSSLSPLSLSSPYTLCNVLRSVIIRLLISNIVSFGVSKRRGDGINFKDNDDEEKLQETPP